MSEFVGSGWSLSLYPESGEAGGAWVPATPSVRRYVPAGEAENPDRAASEAARRARAKIRRYCTAHRLNRFGTLTYAGEGNHDPLLLREHLALFFRELRSGVGGKALPYVWVPEWHKLGHGLHAHFAVGRYVKRSLLVQAWGRGFVHIKLVGDLPVGSGPLDEARRAAGYMAKYVGKGFEDDSTPGLHRYEVAQGFQPEMVKLRGATLDEVMVQAVEIMRAKPGYVWQSQIADGWQGPPAVWASWH